MTQNTQPFSGRVEFTMTIAEAAAATGKSVATMRRWAADGRIRSSHFGKAWMIDATSLPVCIHTRRKFTGKVRVDLDPTGQVIRGTESLIFLCCDCDKEVLG